ncbi:MAG: SIR2 family protein, partial [bacterium]
MLLIGNGLATGFDNHLSGDAISERVTAALGDESSELLGRIAELAQPERPDDPIDVERDNFERFAGPLDRLAEALLAIEDLVSLGGDAAGLRGLRDASVELRRQYFKVVGTVLREVDACCIEPEVDDERRDAWGRINEFAEEVVDWDGEENRVTVFTLNYDSLLMSSMLEASQWVYDGFRGGGLNAILDRWENPALYHLHGSVSWVRRPEGMVSKPRLETIREEGLLDRWAEGDVTEGQPSVILTDMKTPVASRYPFLVFYEELARCLSQTRLAVVGGYGFGDKPLNRALALYLTEDPLRRVRVWHPRPERERYLERLRIQVEGKDGTIADDQVEAEAVTLPDADPV